MSEYNEFKEWDNSTERRNKMNVAEKLRFLADRLEDEKEFYIGRLLHKYQNGELMTALDETEKKCKFIKSGMPLDSLLILDFKLKSQWKFTEDEKVILRNLPDEFRWIARDNISQGLFVYTSKPTKFERSWSLVGNAISLTGFRHLFQCIQWSDDKPCEFRKYL